MKRYKQSSIILAVVLIVCLFCCITTFAAGTGNVAGAIVGTWTTASWQIKTVVNKVIFPAIDLILAVFFFAKLGMTYFDCAPIKAI
jgi:hypothetical protein